MSDTRPVRLLHVPKTAGTTISSSLVRAYGRKHAFPFSGNPKKDRQRLLELGESARKKIRLFYGHSVFETGVAEADRARIITFLREPVDRVKSFIQHAGERKEKYLPDAAPDEPFSVARFLESGNPELSNLQSKMLINRDSGGSEAMIRELGEDAAFELARERLLNGVAAFGIQSHFNEGWVAIWQALGKKPPVYVHLRKIKNSGILSFTPEELERIKDLNRIDIRLYQEAEQEFKRRLDNGTIPREACGDFNRRQARYGPLYSAAWGFAKKLRKRLR